MDNLEDVVNAEGEFPIGLLGVDDIGALWEIHEEGTALVLCQEGIVLVAETAPQATQSNPLAPLETLEQGDAVEELATHVPIELQGGIAVCRELHIVDGFEGIVLKDIGEIGLGHDEQGEGHFLPLDATFHEKVEASPRVEPEALEDAGLGDVVAIVGSQKSFDAQGVAEGEDGGVEIDWQATLLGVDERFTRGQAQLSVQLRGTERAGGDG